MRAQRSASAGRFMGSNRFFKNLDLGPPMAKIVIVMLIISPLLPKQGLGLRVRGKVSGVN